MNLNELGAGTVPIVPIELPISQPVPETGGIPCGCSWGVDLKLGVKYIRYLYKDCPVMAHRIAFGDAQIMTPMIVHSEPEKRGRGQRGKNRRVLGTVRPDREPA
jgi:hypothetical protein